MHVATKKRQARQPGSYSIAAVMVVLLLNAMIGWMLLRSRGHVWENQSQATRNVAAALARDIARNVEQYDLSLRGVEDGLRLSGIDQVNPELRATILFDRTASGRAYGPIRALDATGRTLAMSPSNGIADPPGMIDASRAFFRAARDAPDSGLAIS